MVVTPRGGDQPPLVMKAAKLAWAWRVPPASLATLPRAETASLRAGMTQTMRPLGMLAKPSMPPLMRPLSEPSIWARGAGLKTTSPSILPSMSALSFAVPWRIAAPRTLSSPMRARKAPWALASTLAANANCRSRLGGVHEMLALA